VIARTKVLRGGSHRDRDAAAQRDGSLDRQVAQATSAPDRQVRCNARARGRDHRVSRCAAREVRNVRAQASPIQLTTKASAKMAVPVANGASTAPLRISARGRRSSRGPACSVTTRAVRYVLEALEILDHDHLGAHLQRTFALEQREAA
jgi:hypothetical protein